MEELVCKNCGVIQLVTDAKLYSKKMKNGNIHIQANCNSCGAWIKWIARTPGILNILESLESTKSKNNSEFDMDFDTPDNKILNPIVENNDCDMDFDTMDNFFN